MPNEQLPRHIREWQSRLTGLPESNFTGRALEEKLALLAHWHASKVVAEQMVVMLIAQIMVEEGLSAKDVGGYLGSREVKATPLGRFNFATGIAEWPLAVEKLFLPLLQYGGYRPFLRPDTAKAILDLCTGPEFAWAGLDPGNVADALYRRGLSPYVTKRTLRTLRALREFDPAAAQRMLQALSAVREQAVDTIVDLPKIGERIEGLEPVGADGAASAEEGVE